MMLNHFLKPQIIITKIILNCESLSVKQYIYTDTAKTAKIVNDDIRSFLEGLIFYVRTFRSELSQMQA